MDRSILRFSLVCGAVLLLSACATARLEAQVNVKPFPPDAEPPVTSEDVPYFSQTDLGAYPHHGEGFPGQGYPHRDLRNAHYDIWYRPNSVQGQKGWCDPLPFNPQGVGTPQHTSCHRLDYAPYVLSIPNSQYGPYYYIRQRDLNCCDCCCHGNDKGECQQCDADSHKWYHIWKK